MRLKSRVVGLWPALLVFVFTLALAGCNVGTGKKPGKKPLRSSNAPALMTTAAGAPAPIGACDATPTSTTLTPVPVPPSDATPINVRIHYNRPDGNYGSYGLHLWQINDAGQYVADYPGVTWSAPLVRTGIDGYGAYFDVRANQFQVGAAGFGFIVHPPSQAGDPAVDRLWKFSEGGEFWVRSGDPTIYKTNPIASTPNIHTVRVHYKRFDGAYNQWGLHLWPTSGIDTTRLPGLTLDQWQNPVPLSSMPGYTTGTGEVVFDVPVLNPQGNAARTAVEFIIHGLPSNPNGGVNNKDGWTNNIRVSYAALSVSNGVGEVWLAQGTPTVFTQPPELRTVSTIDMRAVWLDRSRVQWPRMEPTGRFRLYHDADGQIIARRGQAVTGADGFIPLTPTTDVPAALQTRFKWVDGGTVLAVAPADDAALADALDGQMVLVQEDANGLVQAATTAQIAGQLDDRYAAAEAINDFGVSIDGGSTRFKLWAPTARNVTLCTYGPAGGAATGAHEMTLDAATGTWQATRAGDLSGQYYRFVVDTFVRGVGIVRNLVTDPYSLSLNTDSQRSYITRMDSPLVTPTGWKALRNIPALPAQEDMSIYELHVRDFSIGDASVLPWYRGKYMAFTQWNSAGMQHLRALARAGITDVHLLPVFDYANLPEASCVSPVIPNAAADSSQQQAAVNAVRDTDCFNWGYDPWHFNAPEGSFATDASDAATRIREFRLMVQGLKQAGLRVGMDVVYNHTTASGQTDRSVLDRIVPGYYHRYNATGEIERSTCCENTATENRMMGKLMIDSVKLWATEYGIDSFRFDIMGHQPRDVMERLRDEVSAAAGRPIYLIGEGWNFGEVVNGTRFVQADQLSLNGSGIGTFNDRIRDHVRGGSGFDSGIALRSNQGYINGMNYLPNGTGTAAPRSALLWSADVLRVVLAGSLRDYEMTTSWDATLRLEQMDYFGMPAGYVVDPQETVNYVENHDNQTLFDVNAYKLPQTTSREERARVQVLGMAINTFSQGVVYHHAGTEILRSKSLDRNSYNSGDWFNRLDYSYTDNGFGAGLPMQSENGTSWTVMAPLLADALIKPTQAEILWTRNAFLDLLRIRSSSQLFRMRTSAEVKQRLHFHNTGSAQIPTVLVGHLDGAGYPRAGFRDVLYFINVDTVARTLDITAEANKPYRLHPVHLDAEAADLRARTASYTPANGRFVIPARTAVVFVVPENVR